MKPTRQIWKVRDKNRLLLAVMNELAGDAHISFEGDSKILSLATLSDASQLETSVLKRNTLWPQQDFIVVPLEPPTVPQILKKIGGTIPRSALHIQIEKEGRLEFGAYDNFNPESMFFGSAITETFLESLVSEGLLRRMNGVV
jgi:hypothetical protein